jgi:hypothetical protein
MTGAQVIADVNRQADSTSAHIGFGLEVIGFVFMAIFLAWLCDALKRHGALAWLSTLALVGGVTTLAVKLASGAPVIALMSDRKVVDDQTALVLSDMNSAAFVITFVTFGIFMIGVGLAVLDSGMLGKVAGWSAVAIGAAGIVVPVSTSLDPFTSNPVPFLLGLVWVLVVSIKLAVRGPRKTQDAGAVAGVPVHA